MRRWLVIPVLFVVCPAWAVWEQVAADERIYLFADRQTIQKQEGHLVRMSHLVDHKAHYPGEGLTFQSARVEAVYDCRENRFQELSASFHPYRLGEGGALKSSAGAGDWQKIPKGSGVELLADIACQREKAAKDRAKNKSKGTPPGGAAITPASPSNLR